MTYFNGDCMNIFALDENPVIAASMMMDKHVVKMPTETCQMLHTNYQYMSFVKEYGYVPSQAELRKYHIPHLMKPVMMNHPSTKWARESKQNHEWLVEHAIAICKEYTRRYNKVHRSETRIKETPTICYPDGTLSPLTMAINDEWKLEGNGDWKHIVSNYRHYYIEAKWRFATWKSNTPEWWPKEHIKNKWKSHYNWMRAENERIRRKQNE